jgi:flagellar M-ring protein FliF
MEFFRRAIRQIKAQLGILTTSQRLVVILLLIIMCGAVLWMIKYAGQREMVPLLNTSLAENDLQSIVSKLDGWEQEYEVKGDRILVPKSDQKKLIARLAYDGSLPEDTSISWITMMGESDIWTPPGVRDDRNLIIKQTELARIIAQFPGVETAQVIINKAKERRLSNIQPPASASVSVTTSRGSASERRLADSIAEFVSGANRNMSAGAVRVLINGNLVPILDEDQKMSADFLEKKAKCERDYRAKIENVVAVPNALVVVDVLLQRTKTNQKSKEFMEEGGGTVNSTIEKTTKETKSTENKSNNEPGVGANFTNNQSSGGTGREETTEETTSRSVPSVGVTEILLITPAGDVKDITATVRIPESHYENQAKKKAGDSKVPTAAEIQALIDADLLKIENSVKTLLANILKQAIPENTAQPHVEVNTYWDQGSLVDSASALSGEGASEAGATGSVTGVARQYGKQIAVSALALLSLFMALMMVRRATGPVELDEEEATALMMQGKKPMDALSVEDSNLAEGAEGGLLAGVELDDETVRSQQMLEQIKSMVQDSPDSAASLINKWVKGAE